MGRADAAPIVLGLRRPAPLPETLMNMHIYVALLQRERSLQQKPREAQLRAQTQVPYVQRQLDECRYQIRVIRVRHMAHTHKYPGYPQAVLEWNPSGTRLEWADFGCLGGGRFFLRSADAGVSHSPLPCPRRPARVLSGLPA